MNSADDAAAFHALVIEADRIRLVVNRDAELRAGLKISSKVLALATILRE